MLTAVECDEDDNEYTFAIKALAAAMACSRTEFAFEIIEEDGGASIMHDLRVAIAEHHPALHAKLQELIVAEKPN